MNFMQESKNFNLSDYLLLSSPLYNNELWALKRKLLDQNSLTYAYDNAIRGDAHSISKLLPLGIAGAIAHQGHRLPGMLPGLKFRKNVANIVGRSGMSVLGPKAKALLAAVASIPITQAITSGEMTRRTLQDKSASETYKNTQDIANANIAAGVSSVIPSLLGSFYFNKLVPKIYNKVPDIYESEWDSKTEKLFDRFLRKKNIQVVDPITSARFTPKSKFGPAENTILSKFFASPAYTPNNDTLISRLIKKIIDKGKRKDNVKGFIINPHDFYSYYTSPARNKIKGAIAPGILAHETGHALGPDIYTKPVVRRLSTLAPILATGNIIHTKNEEVGRNTALASPLLAAPLLASEFDASMRGHNLLKKLTKGKLTALQKLSPFVGLPTYLAASAAPSLAHLTKKYMGGYES